MLELKTYTSEELAEALGISINTLNLKRKVTEERHLSDYTWSKEGKGKKTIYKIEKLNNESSSLIDTFYSLLEGFSGKDIHFKNPETAIKVLYYLFQRNENIALFISRDLGIAERTIRDYIKRFRKLGLLVGYWDRFIVDEKEIEKQVLLPTEYDYYQVMDGKWHETNLNGWLDAWAYRRNAYKQYVEEIENETGFEITKEQDKVAKILSYNLMVEEFGEQKRVEHKYLNEDAKECLGSFLIYAAKDLGLAFEKRDKKSKEYISNLYKKPSMPKNISKELVLDNSNEAVDVGRKHIENEVKEMAPKSNSFKDFKNHVFMQVPEVEKIKEEEVEDMNNNLKIDEDPFTEDPIVFNEKTQKWEKYIEHEWVNGEKVKQELNIVPFIPRQKSIKTSSALDEMFGSAI
jgi:hypothetical protein